MPCASIKRRVTTSGTAVTLNDYSHFRATWKLESIVLDTLMQCILWEDSGCIKSQVKPFQNWSSPCGLTARDIALPLDQITIFTMADVFTKAKRSEVMAAIRSTGNKATELKLVQLFRQQGITGWRRHQPILGKPDFIFRAQRVALFVDGCFWHGCRWHCRMPKSNKKYWRAKIARNVARDHANMRLLRASDWKVIRIWGHSLGTPKMMRKASAKITSVLSRQMLLYHHQKSKNEPFRKILR